MATYPDQPCAMCQRPFTPKRLRAKICGAWECRSALGAATGAMSTAARRAKVPPRIAPIPGKARTVLQPCIAPYIASLAAASKSMETRA
ncbi:hypothetical protein GCM10007320_09100 [Pseudorhodoferax aquiterrae]|uniref:Uncharacterized protein n=1 Tax=Pseudorhodoferax aquiterrae TaxID=747304 RepID=A0ABQ3FWN2_9BURK|nr:hypothetical protein [Pseudorhodoferax aquiterrae]GHC72895.1 hypothetical protein GCM10007320_09100 [Pseudorhodoferax aquiterrae]